MNTHGELAARRVVAYMNDNIGEPVTIDDMARTALFSKFHFTRVFQCVTGVSPGRFLSALRLQRAKQLLLSTSLSVADISIRVGYASVGTFSSRFARSVGMSPSTYRRRGGFTTDIPVESATGDAGGIVRGVTNDTGGRVFIGLFPERIPEGRPVQCTVLDRPGRFVLDPVPAGSWYVLAQSIPADGGTGDGRPWVASHGPVGVRHGTAVDVRLTLQPMRSLDPPVLLALQDARQSALSREQARHAMAGRA